MDPAIKTLDAKSVFDVPLGELLVIQWNQDGTRAGAAQIIEAKKPSELVVAVWSSGSSFGGTFHVWRLKVEDRALVELRHGFQCTFRPPTEKELASIKSHVRKFPAPEMPPAGTLVFVHYLDVELGGEEMAEFVGIVSEQRFDEMTVDAHYYSVKQGKIIQEPIIFDRTSDRWADRELRNDATISAIERAHFDRWLAEDEKANKPDTSAKSAAVTKPAPKHELRKRSGSKKAAPRKAAKRAAKKR